MVGQKPVDTAIVMIVGPLIDDSDFKTLEESIAYDAAGMDVSLIIEKTDGTSTVTAITLTTGGTSDFSHKDGGYYEVEITAAQNAEEGIAYVRGVCTGVLPFESAHYNIVTANVYDSLIKGTDNLEVDATAISGDSSAADNLELDYDGTGYAKANSTVGTCTTNTDMRGTDSANTTVPDIAGTAATLHGNTDGHLTDIKGTGFVKDTDSMPQCLTAVGFATENPPSQVLADYKADVTNLDAAVSTRNSVVPDVAGTAAGLHATTDGHLTDVKGTGFVKDTDSLPQCLTATGFNTVTPPTVGEIDTEITSTHGAGSWITATGFSTHSAADVWEVVIEGTHRAKHLMRLIISVLSAKVTGGGTSTIVYRDISDTKDRVTATVSEEGNRTAIVLDES